MPDEVVVDLSHSEPQPVVRPMSDVDATALAAAQAASAAEAAAISTHDSEIGTVLLAYMANGAPTLAQTADALRNVIKAIARDH